MVGGNGIRFARGKRCPGYYVGYHSYNPATGAKTHHTKNFVKQSDAREWLKRRNARIDLDELGEVVPITLSEATAEFLNGLTARAKDTRTHYGSALGMLRGLCGDLMVNGFSGSHVDAFVRDRMNVSTQSTTAKHVRSLGAFFNWSIKRGYATTNPIHGATALPSNTHRRERPTVSFEQLTAIIAALDTEDRRVAVWIAMTAGLDRGVITRLTPEQTDIPARCFRFNRPKKDKAMIAPIHSAIVPALSERLSETQPCQPLLAGLHRQDKHRDWWKLAVTSAGVPDLLFRDLRAIASSRLAEKAGLMQARDLLGHADVRTTANHYSMPDPNILQRLDELALPGLPQT